MKLIETHCHGKDCERKNNCYRYVILQEKLKNNPSQALWFVQSSLAVMQTIIICF